MSFFAVAPQTIPLAENASVVFEVDPVDSAIVYMSMLKRDGSGHRWSFARNGTVTGLSEVAATDDKEPEIEPPAADEETGAKRGRHR